MSIVEKDINGKPLTESYDEFLIESLQDPKEARAYLNAALEDEDYRVFLLALRDVADAFGMTKIAAKAGLNRENIYRMLSKKGNPTIASLFPILHAIGVRLNIELAKPVVKERHYKVESETIETRNFVPSYANSKFQPFRSLPQRRAVHKPQAAVCDYQMAA